MEKSNLEKFKRIFTSPALASILRWSKPAHGAILLLSVLSVVGSLMSLATTLVTKGLIDGATSRNMGAIWKYAALLVGLYAAMRLMSIGTTPIRVRTSTGLQRHMQSLVTSSLLRKEYGKLKGYHSGELVNRVFSDSGVVQGGVMSMLPSILTTLVSFVGAAVILVSMDWRFIPIMLFAALVGSGIMLAFRGPLKDRHKRMQAAGDALHAVTQETLENIRVVKASGSEARSISAMDEKRARVCEEQIRNTKLSLLMNNVMGVAFSASSLGCFLWGVIKIYHGTFTYGSLGAIMSLMSRVQAPISSAVGLVSQAYGIVASAERMLDILGLPDEESGPSLPSFTAIRLEYVTFQYDDGVNDVLMNLNAEIARGDFVALTGMSGGGKTSLFQLLLGIYRPTAGRVIFTDGQTEVPATAGTRGLFAYVPQGNTLFSGTLRDNLTMFTDAATDEEVQAAVKAACLEELVDEIGLNAMLGERGVGLSEGQAQRVAVARALLTKAPILLLDEATSALDETTEAKMLENISAMRDKTCIIVTHRRAALAICDYALHIEDGRMTRKEAVEHL